jgi:arginyl-tRNA synthetase
LSANQVLQTVNQAVEAPTPALRRDIMLAAVKYAFLKQRLGGDIAFDVAESVSLQGNSGPYIQYAHARARSILSKSTTKPLQEPAFEAGERSLVRQLAQFSPTVQQAVQELAPHLLCTYLYELCQTFNRFYEHNRVLGDPRQDIRLQLVQCYADTLRSGLELLNIPAPNHI